MSFDFTVDIIIPVRYRKEYDICERLAWKLDCKIPKNFSISVIDYGSKKEHANEIRECCGRLEFNYTCAGKSNSLWNASKARNIGILKSKSDYLIFEDLDLRHSSNFYERINSEIEVLLESKEWPFLVIPVTYLSEEGSSLFREEFDYKKESFLVNESYKGSSDFVEFHAAASSFLVCKRSTSILVGGYDQAFEGWGFEDSDFWLRLLINTDFEKPRDFFFLDTRNYSLQVNWLGWRSLFRIFADLMANRGLRSFHIWHPIAEHRSPSIREKNHRIFRQNCERYSSKGFAFTPLIDESKPKHLFLSKNPHSWNNDLFKFFDNPICIDERDIDVNTLESLLIKNNISSVIFNNPYGSHKRLSIYEKIKSINFKFYVVERGALPWSIYIDKDGFCAESKSYKESNWIHNRITSENRENTEQYIHEIKSSGTTLEPQSPMIGGSNLKRKLFGESEGLKILFIALQSPSDTTTNYFCGQVGSYTNFISEVSKLPYVLPKNWKVVVKNHPLSIEKFEHPDIVCVDQYHIGDVLECCDAVALINSGVGVLAQIYEKHTYIFGKAFYSCQGLNTEVLNSDELVSSILDGVNFDSDKAFRFINYLVNDFYSFASWRRAERKHTDKANLSISLDIKYNKVVVLSEFSELIDVSYNFDLKKSFLFDRYRMDDYINRSSGVVPDNKKATNVINKSKNIDANNKEKTKDGMLCNKNNLLEATITKKTNIERKKTFNRKLNKLFRSPKVFFVDALLNFKRV